MSYICYHKGKCTQDYEKIMHKLLKKLPLEYWTIWNREVLDRKLLEIWGGGVKCNFKFQ